MSCQRRRFTPKLCVTDSVSLTRAFTTTAQMTRDLPACQSAVIFVAVMSFTPRTLSGVCQRRLSYRAQEDETRATR